MSFRDCIANNELLSKRQRDNLLLQYDETLKFNDEVHGSIEASERATQAFIQSRINKLEAKKRSAVKSALVANNIYGNNGRITQKAVSYKARKDKTNPEAARWLYWDSNVAGALANDLQQTAYFAGQLAASYRQSIADTLMKYSSKYAGLYRDSAGFEKVVRELLGQATGDDGARAMALPIKKLLKTVINNYRAAGGFIGEIADNYFPQRDIYDSILDAARRAGFTDDESAKRFWKTEKMALIDRTKMKDPVTGLPYSSEQLDRAMDEIWIQMRDNTGEELETVGLRQLQLDSRGDLYDKKSAHRFFVYKDADAYMKNVDMFGGGRESMYDMLLDYLNGMARDTEVMRQYGPRAGSVIKIGMSLAKTDGASRRALAAIKGLYDTVSGANSFGGQVGAFTKILEGTQHWMRASFLGGALLSSVSDSFLSMMTARYNGLPLTNVIKNQAAYLNPLDSTDRMIAQQRVYLSQSIMGASLKQARQGDYASGAGVARWASGFVHRAGALGIWTDSLHVAVPQETMFFFAASKNKGYSFADLPDAMREAFARWNMDERDYANIIASEMSEFRPGVFGITQENVRAVSPDTARKYGAWLYEMSQVASNEPTLMTRAITSGAILGGESSRGTYSRNIGSTLFMFKSYGITVLINHIIPALQRAGSEGKWGRVAAIMTAMPLLGALSIQAKDVVYGKTPRAMDNVDFWRQAFLQSGVFGYYSDFIFADYSRYGQSSGSIFAGPVFGAFDDLKNTFHAALESAFVEGKENEFAKELAANFKAYTPKLWYTRVLQEQLMYNQINRLADPNFDHKMRLLERKMERKTGSEFWAKPYE